MDGLAPMAMDESFSVEVSVEMSRMTLAHPKHCRLIFMMAESGLRLER
jgi:hypothetical protein